MVEVGNLQQTPQQLAVLVALAVAGMLVLVEKHLQEIENKNW